MAKTNYKECRWLVKAVAGDFEDGSYRNGTGYSLRNLFDLDPPGFSMDRSILYDTGNIRSIRMKDSFRQSIMRWRAIIYNEFGLAILQASDPGVIAKKGGGGYYYYLANPELLDKGGKTLKELIDFLADSETHRDSWVTVGQIEKHFRAQTASMGYISAGGAQTYGYLSKEGTSYRTILGEENLEIIQFAMQFGETLTIKYGKISKGIDIDAPYSFEPFQLKEIEGRWFVIGSLYPLGHKDEAEIAFYDLARLEFADEENPDVLYEPVKGFDILNHLKIDKDHQTRIGKVISINLHARELDGFADYLSKHPFCSAQEEAAPGEFKVYVRISTDLIIQLAAYGEELSFDIQDSDETWIDDYVRYQYFFTHTENGYSVAIME